MVDTHYGRHPSSMPKGVNHKRFPLYKWASADCESLIKPLLSGSGSDSGSTLCHRQTVHGRHARHTHSRTDGEHELLDHGGAGDEAVVRADGDAEAVGQHVLQAVFRDVVAQLRHGLPVGTQAHLVVVVVRRRRKGGRGEMVREGMALCYDRQSRQPKTYTTLLNHHTGGR
jgi:hypothetical protein